MTVLLGADREAGSDLPLAQQFRFDAGSPALNLLATLGYRGAEPVERLTSARRLRQWLTANALPEVDVDAGDVAEARGLREAGYAVLAALADARTPKAADIAILNRWLAEPQPPALLTSRKGTLSWATPESSARSVLGALARQLAAVAIDQPMNLRVCTAESCRMLYLDGSRGRRRRWCSMSRCGNAAKVARHRSQSAGAQ